MVPRSANARPLIFLSVIASHAPEEIVYCTVPLTPLIIPYMQRRKILGRSEPNIKLTPPNSPHCIASFMFPCRYSEKRREIIDPIRNAHPMVDSIIPSPLASEKVKTIGGKRTVVNPHKKLEILKIETSVNNPF